MTTKLQTVHVRINDVATGKPTPCRVRFTDAEGRYYAPFGRLSKFATSPGVDVGGNVFAGIKQYAYVDGAFEIALPPGPIRVQIEKGPEYRPVDATQDLPAGKLSMRLSIDRWFDARALGWYSGDIRAHFLSPHAALLEGQAEDLAVTNVLVRALEVEDAFRHRLTSLPNILAFSGQKPIAESQGHVVVVNSHNHHPELGSLGLLNCHRPVFPLAFGGPDGLENWTFADWCDQCHRKGGLVVWTTPQHETAEFMYGEPLADLILGKVDSFEFDFFEDSPFDVINAWYDLLSVGFFPVLVGGSGKDSNGKRLGVMRTYAFIGTNAPISYQAWIEAIRAGRTFVSNGPLLFLDINKLSVPTTTNFASTSQTFHVHVEGKTLMSFQRLELLCLGEVLASASPSSSSPAAACLDLDLTLKDTSWLSARIVGDSQVADRPSNQKLFAHSSAVLCNVGNKPVVISADKAKKFLKALKEMRDWVDRKGRFENDAQRQRLLKIFDDACQVLLARAAAAG